MKNLKLSTYIPSGAESSSVPGFLETVADQNNCSVPQRLLRLLMHEYATAFFWQNLGSQVTEIINWTCGGGGGFEIIN